jgi:hypothetical protein
MPNGSRHALMACLRQVNGIDGRVICREDGQEYPLGNEGDTVFSSGRTLDSPELVP